MISIIGYCYFDERKENFTAAEKVEKKWLTLVQAIPEYLMQSVQNYRVIFINPVHAGFNREGFISTDIKAQLPESKPEGFAISLFLEPIRK